MVSGARSLASIELIFVEPLLRICADRRLHGRMRRDGHARCDGESCTCWLIARFSIFWLVTPNGDT